MPLHSATLDLFASLPAGSQAVETSEAASDSLSGDYLGRIRRQVLAYVVSCGEYGATADEIAQAFNCSHNTTSPRLTELITMRKIERLDGKEGREHRTRPTRSHRPAFVHISR